VLLFVSGLAIAQTGGPIRIAIGTSVSATGVCGWAIYFWIRVTDNSTQALARIRQIGIIDAFPARSVPIRPEYERRFNAARDQIDFLGFGLRALREDFGDSFSAWLNHTRIRVLLVDPEAPSSELTYADQRDREEGNSKQVSEKFANSPLLLHARDQRLPNRQRDFLGAVHIGRTEQEYTNVPDRQVWHNVLGPSKAL
jgi:hypothetical protein